MAGCAREPGGDPLRLVPAAPTAAIVAPSLATLQARAAGFLGGVEGASGVLDLIADRFGLDLKTPEGPATLGLDSGRGLAVFAHGGAEPDAALAWALAVSVDDPERFLEGARTRLERGAGATLAPGQGDAPPEGEAWLFVRDGWRAALGVTRDRIGLCVLATGEGDAVALWNQIAAPGGAGFAASPLADKARATLGQEAVAWIVAPNLLPDAPRGLGLARGLVQSTRDALGAFVGGVAMPLGEVGVEALVVEVAADHEKDGALPVAWVSPAGSPEALAHAFPKTTTAFLRLRFEIEKVRALPGFLRDTMLPDRLPGFEALPLPGVSDLIDLIEGDVAVGLLGLDPRANLGQLGSVRALRARFLETFHVALAARLRDPNAAKRTFASIAAQLATSGWTVAPIVGAGGAGGAAGGTAPGTASGAPWAGWSFVREGAHYAVLIDDRVAVFIVGAGEVDGFLAVKDGRALSLATFAEGGSRIVKQALGLEGKTPLGLTLSPLRLSRELSARGMPPYFLKIINDVRLFSATVSATEKRLGLGLEIAL